jgi:hypothetical protein
MTKQMLEAFVVTGFLLANDGADATAAHARQGLAIDLALTDRTMPFMDDPASRA